MTTYGWTERTRLSHINAGDFCLAPLAQVANFGEDGQELLCLLLQDSGDDDAVVALLCDTCAEQVSRSYCHVQRHQTMQ